VVEVYHIVTEGNKELVISSLSPIVTQMHFSTVADNMLRFVTLHLLIVQYHRRLLIIVED